MTPTLTTEDSVVVTVKVTGDLPEIQKYRFDYKLSTDTIWKTAGTRVSNYRTYGYTYDLGESASGKEYNLRVTAIDVEGEPYTSEIATAKAEYNGYFVAMNPEDTSLTGKTVDYIPEVKTTDIATSTLTGHTSNQTFKTEALGWNIWGEDENYIFLIASLDTSELKLKGENGCNNGVYYVNRISEYCYNSNLYEGTISRSISGSDLWNACGNKESDYSNSWFSRKATVNTADIRRYVFPLSVVNRYQEEEEGPTKFQTELRTGTGSVSTKSLYRQSYGLSNEMYGNNSKFGIALEIGEFWVPELWYYGHTGGQRVL